MPRLRSSSDGLPPGSRRGEAATRKKAKAYQSVFKAGNEETEIVLSDLMKFTGFCGVTHPKAGELQITFNEGQRSVFERIFRFLNMSDADIRDLYATVQHEMLIDAQEGEGF